MEKRRILQIIPADGWYAWCRNDTIDKNAWKEPLACWALVADEDGHRSVVGMYAAEVVEFCNQDQAFQFYLGPGEDIGIYADDDEASDG